MFRSRFAALAAALSVCLPLVPPALAAEGSIAGVAVTARGEPAAGSKVLLVELRRRTQAGPDGAFRFDAVPEGHYHLQVTSPRWGTALAEVDVAAGRSVEVRVAIDLGIHEESLVVSASADARSLAEVAQPVAILEGTELLQRAQATLGETLAQEPGVSSSYYAPGASRPVIRGFTGDRVRILEDGLGTADASNVSPDHAVSYDPMGADRIEVVRGAATLLYGSSAVGGVVNVLDGRVPDHVPTSGIEGSFGARFGSAADERAGSVDLRGGGGRFAWQAGYLDRRADDLDTPEGTIVNSDVDTTRGTVGASYVGTKGFVGLAYTDFASNYGSAVEEEVRIDLDQQRFDLRGEYDAPAGFLRSIRARAGIAEYEHVELEGEEVGTRFSNDSWEARAELLHRRLGAFEGNFGVQLSDRDFRAEGEEAYVQPTRTTNQALFAFEEIGRGRLVGELGARYERQQTDSSDPALRDRDFDAFSGSAGAVWKPAEAWSIALSLARSTRLPTPEELYSDGPHVATFAYEVGDDDLGKESSLGIDLSVRRLAGKVRGEVNLFRDDFDDYIYDEATGDVDVDSGLPIYRFTQQDAEFRGLEAVVHFELFHSEPHHVELDLRYDTVRAELADGTPLPRIPAARYGIAVQYQGPRLWGNLEVLRTADQNRVAPLETPTAGSTWLNAAVGYRILAGRAVHDLILRGVNLTDELARNHGSRFKDVVPLTGRDIGLTYRLTF
jgi:iron complex outermembrane receptor protein